MIRIETKTDYRYQPQGLDPWGFFNQAISYAAHWFNAIKLFDAKNKSL